jgi:heavy metal sensor kinase
MTKFLRTVTFRLTLWYAALFFSVSIIVFGIIYITLANSLMQRMDKALIENVREIELLYNLKDTEIRREGFRREAVSVGSQRMFFRIITPQMKVIESSNMNAWKGIDFTHRENLSQGKEVLESLKVAGHRHSIRVVSKRISDGNIIQIGSTRHDDDELMEAYREVSVIAILVFLICGGLVGWFMARRAMSGVERVTQTAVNIGKADLTTRVPLGDEGEEINNLARAFNDMLTRIQGLFTELKDVTNNIAHDLRSPITRIRGLAETTLTGEQDVDSYREMAGAVVEESDRLVEMINIMLEIAMTEFGMQNMVRDDVDLTALLETAYDLFQILAEDKGLQLRIEAPRDPLIMQGNLSQLQRMIGNLLDNAIKFTPRGGFIKLSLLNTSGQLVISVSDTGIGIVEQDIPRIFERFYRGDQSRSTIGNGLGLSHVLAIVRAHEGKISVKSSPGKGSTFIVTFPRI